MAKKRRSRQFKKSSRVIDVDEARRIRLEKRRIARENEERERTPGDQRRIKRKKELRKKQTRRRIVIAAVILVLLAALGFSFASIVKLKKEQADIQEKRASLEKKKARMQQELNDIEDDKTVEEKAREKLRLVLPGETIYIPDSE